MQAESSTSNPDDLQVAKRQFTRWRATHLAGTRIPSHLWSAASELANVYGVSRTARTLGLDYSSLSKRTERAPSPSTNPFPDPPASHGERSPSPESASTPPEFIEFSLDSLTPPRTCVVEIVGATDLRLRLDLKGYPAAELDTILRAAWDTARCSN